MVGTIVSLAASAAGAIAGGIGSAMANRRRQRQLESERAKAGAFYLNELYQDPTRRSDNAEYLRLLEKKLDRANEIARNRGKILGATHEQELARHQAAADAYADAIGNMSSRTAQRRDMYALRHRAEDNVWDNKQELINASEAENWGNLANNAVKLGESAIYGFSGVKRDKNDGKRDE